MRLIVTDGAALSGGDASNIVGVCECKTFRLGG